MAHQWPTTLSLDALLFGKEFDGLTHYLRTGYLFLLGQFLQASSIGYSKAESG